MTTGGGGGQKAGARGGEGSPWGASRSTVRRGCRGKPRSPTQLSVRPLLLQAGPSGPGATRELPGALPPGGAHQRLARTPTRIGVPGSPL